MRDLGAGDLMGTREECSEYETSSQLPVVCRLLKHREHAIRCFVGTLDLLDRKEHDLCLFLFLSHFEPLPHFEIFESNTS